ncbi:MAG: hypothetical protein HC932_00515 [Thermales bacterium]|nr:hypothetical protein [Thermales bacterium]
MSIDIVESIFALKSKLLSCLNNDYFLRVSSVSQAKIGATFVPEYFDNQETNMLILRTIVEDFGMQYIRIGIRWDRTQPNKSLPTLEYYRQYLDYLYSKSVNITFSLGPIKSPRWPEYFIPKWILDTCKCPAHGCTINTKEDLSQFAFDYLDSIVNLLKKEIPKTQLNKHIFEIENECYNPFGKYQWIFSDGYLNICYRTIRKKFSNNLISFSSSGSRNYINILNLSNSYKLNPKGIIINCNYYYIFDKNYNDPFAFLYDDWVRYNKKTIREIKKEADSNKFLIGIGEAQMEPWKRAKTPGNTIRSLRFVLDRVIRIRPNNQKLFVINLWGIEELVNKSIINQSTKEHILMIDLIKKNQQ